MANFYDSADRWNSKHCPDTSPNAKPTAEAKVVNATVIATKAAMYRGACVNGVFLLADAETKIESRGKYRVKVYCRWFGHRLHSGVPISLLVDGTKTTKDPNYSGYVVSNISR